MTSSTLSHLARTKRGPHGPDDPRYLIYGQVAEQIEAAIREGRAPDLAALEQQYPEIAVEIRQFAEALKILDELGHSSDSLPLGLAGAPEGAAPLGRLGDFQLLREIGRGGMGIVYEAEQLSLRRRVALKVLPFAAVLDPQHLQRFKNEAQAAGSLNHPNIVTVYSVGCERGVHYYAMQFVEGQTLAEVIEGLKQSPAPSVETNGAAPTATALSSTRGSREFYHGVARLGIQAAEALGHAHQMGIVHRDIKPTNLMVDADGGLWVTDFGLAMTGADPGLTMTGDILGTLRYMSPEQASGERGVLDHRTDIHSLGVTLYELVALRAAFAGDDRKRLLRQIVEEEPPPPSQLNKSIPRDLETIILKAMSKEPQTRYATAQQMADDLKRFLEHRPIHAKRPSLADRAGKWARRHRTVVSAAVAFLMLVVAVFSVSTFLVLVAYQGEREQRAAADANAAKAQRNYETARQAVKQMVTRVADEQVGRIPEMKEVRRRLLEDAAAFYTELLKLSPRDPMAFCERGEVYGLLGQYAKARADHEKAIELDPDNATFRHALGWFLYHCPDLLFRDYHLALVHEKRALQLEHRDPRHHVTLVFLYVILGRRDEALAELPKVEQLAAGSPELWGGLAECYRVLGEPRKALPYAEKNVSIHANEPWGHWQLSQLCRELGDEEKALAAISKAIEINPRPNDTSTFYFYDARGEMLSSARKYDAALRDYSAAVELGPFRSELYKNRADTHFKLKNYDKALVDLAKAVELKPDDTSNVRWIPLQLVAKCPDERFRSGVLALADKTVQLNQRVSEAYCIRARLHAAFGHRKAALADLDKARQLDPNHTWLPRQYPEAYITHFAVLQPGKAGSDQAIAEVRQHVRSRADIAPAWLRWVSHWLPVMMRGSDNAPGIVFASDIPWVRWSCGGGPGRPIRDTDAGWFDGTTPIAGLPYSKSILTHAFLDERAADIVLDLTGRKFVTLRADVGPCDNGTVQFQVLVDGKVRHQTPVMRFGAIEPISVDVAGAKEVVLRVLNGGDGNSADSAGWGYARFLQAGTRDPLEEPPSQHQSATEADAALFLATIHRRLDQTELARRWYNKAVEWMDKYKVEAEKLEPFRFEAARLLGITEETSTQEEKPK